MFFQILLIVMPSILLAVSGAVTVNNELDLVGPLVTNNNNASAGVGYSAMDPLYEYEYVSAHPSGIPAVGSINIPFPTSKTYTNLRKISALAVITTGFYQGTWNTESSSLAGGVNFSVYASSTNIFLSTSSTWSVTSDNVTFYIFFSTT